MTEGSLSPEQLRTIDERNTVRIYRRKQNVDSGRQLAKSHSPTAADDCAELLRHIRALQQRTDSNV